MFEFLTVVVTCQAMPYVDILFGNESEAKAFGEKMGYPVRLSRRRQMFVLSSSALLLQDTSPEAVALEIAKLPKENKNRPRIVVITHGAEPTIVVENFNVTKYPVPRVPPEEIVDANGAGDAFVGGFLAEIIRGRSIADAVRAGHYAARVILGVSGTVIPAHPPKPREEWPTA